jgi:hypothetical protein
MIKSIVSFKDAQVHLNSELVIVGVLDKWTQATQKVIIGQCKCITA